MREYFKNAIHIIENALESLEDTQYEKLLEQCVNCVKNGGKIIASGLGKNVPICEKFVGTLNSLSIPSAFLHTNSAMHGDLGLVKPGDLAIVLSKSGNTVESVDLVRHIINRGNKLWLISFEESSRLTGLVDNRIIMRLEHEGDKWNIVPNNSTSVYLLLLQGLAMNLADKLDITIDRFGSNHPGGSIGEYINTLSTTLE